MILYAKLTVILYAKLTHQVGFNRGNGTAWTPVQRFSGLPAVVDMDNSSNSDAWGRYIARIDGLYDTIKPGGCNNDTQGQFGVSLSRRMTLKAESSFENEGSKLANQSRQNRT